MLAKLKDRLGALPKTYTYALLLLAAGLLLVLLPRSREETATKPAEQSNAFAENCEARLEEMLSHTAGVGKARVMLTEESSTFGFSFGLSKRTRSMPKRFARSCRRHAPLFSQVVQSRQ